MFGQRILDWDFFEAFETIRGGALFLALAAFFPKESFFGDFGVCGRSVFMTGSVTAVLVGVHPVKILLNKVNDLFKLLDILGIYAHKGFMSLKDCRSTEFLVD